MGACIVGARIGGTWIVIIAMKGSHITLMIQAYFLTRTKISTRRTIRIGITSGATAHTLMVHAGGFRRAEKTEARTDLAFAGPAKTLATPPILRAVAQIIAGIIVVIIIIIIVPWTRACRQGAITATAGIRIPQIAFTASKRLTASERFANTIVTNLPLRAFSIVGTASTIVVIIIVVIVVVIIVVIVVIVIVVIVVIVVIIIVIIIVVVGAVRTNTLLTLTTLRRFTFQFNILTITRFFARRDKTNALGRA
jgi:hypothetical protein